MRSRAYRRHQANRHMRRRLKEDRNQHYNDLGCGCWHNPKVMAFFKEQPKRCSCWMCANRRRLEGPTMQERRPDQGTCMGDKEYLNKCCSCPHGLQKLETLLAAEFGS